MLDEITGWFLELFRKVFEALWSFVTDIVIAIVDLALSAVVGLLGAIPVPPALAAGLGSLWSSMDPAVIYFLSMFGVPPALALIGSGFVFRMARKVVTLFQW